MSIIYTSYDDNRGWTAIHDGYDGGMIDIETMSDDPIGHGCTEWEAVRDLLEQST